MEVQQFEQAILKMAFETDAKITTASVAYYLGIPSRKANELLETLLEQGVLELDSDHDGNLYYFVPNQGDRQSLTEPSPDDGWEQLEAAADAAAKADEPSAHRSTGDDEFSEHFDTSIESVEESDHEPFSPNQFSPYQGADGRPTEEDKPTPRFEESSPRTSSDDGWSQYGRPSSDSSPYGAYEPRHSPQRESRFDGIPHGVTSRLGRPDARPDRCGNASVIVEDAASCEPRPLAEAKPTVTSCNDVDTSSFSTHQDYGGFGFTAPSSSTALAPTTSSGEMALTADNHIEQPEHQPGMALLLSLILCGTGQIYNGEVSKGIIMLILCFLLWFVFLGWVVHIWSIVDAVVVAERINRKSSSNG